MKAPRSSWPDSNELPPSERLFGVQAAVGGVRNRRGERVRTDHTAIDLNGRDGSASSHLALRNRHRPTDKDHQTEKPNAPRAIFRKSPSPGRCIRRIYKQNIL